MTPDQARSAINALGDAFAGGDVDAVLGQFAAEGEIMYAGSEPGEVAVGRSAVRLLLTNLFSRDERYSWTCGAVHVAACHAGFAVLADAMLTVDPWPTRPEGAGREHLPYRVSGLLEDGRGGWRWRVCQGSEPASSDEG